MSWGTEIYYWCRYAPVLWLRRVLGCPHDATYEYQVCLKCGKKFD